MLFVRDYIVRLFLFASFLIVWPNLAYAKKIGAVGLLEIHEVSRNIYAFVGDLGQRHKKNLGNNATFGLVVTNEGAVLIDSGGSLRGARQIEEAISKVTDKPVVTVINTGGQDHRWFGNAYFREKGAKIISSTAALDDQEERASVQYAVMNQLIGEKTIEGTELENAEINFDDKHVFKLGGVTFEIHVLGGAHSIGDSFVWLPEQNIVFGGDIVFMDRLLAVREISYSSEWLKSFEAIEALKPKIIIPGHGKPASLQQAKKETYDYLIYLRKTVKAHIKSEGTLSTVTQVDQSKWSYMAHFKILAGRNAMAVYDEMEFE